MENNISTEYGEFLINNRANVNRYLNLVLWFFAVTGPAIAAGVYSGTFKDISYTTCISISVIVVLMAGIHRFLLIKFPKSTGTCLFALTALNVLIMYYETSQT